MNLDGSLTRDGKKFLAAAPDVLKSADFTRKMEAFLRQPGEEATVRGLMEKVLGLLPDEIREKMTGALAEEVESVRWEDFSREADMEGPGEVMSPSFG